MRIKGDVVPIGMEFTVDDKLGCVDERWWLYSTKESWITFVDENKKEALKILVFSNEIICKSKYAGEQKVYRKGEIDMLPALLALFVKAEVFKLKVKNKSKNLKEDDALYNIYFESAAPL
jgi:hypothetical protein